MNPHNAPLHRIRELWIKANLKVHPIFQENPSDFIRNNRLKVVHHSSQSRYSYDQSISSTNEEITQSIHLVKHGAIQLFIHTSENGCFIKQIKINPSLLTGNSKRFWLPVTSLRHIVEIAEKYISPLLADSRDSEAILPRELPDKILQSEWSVIDFEVLIPGVLLPHLHHLSHPATVAIQGATGKRVELVSENKELIIRFKNEQNAMMPDKDQSLIAGTRIRVILKGNMLHRHIDELFGDSKNHRFQNLTLRDILRLHHSIMNGMKGIYIPCPAKWINCADQLEAKILAILSHITDVTLEQHLTDYLAIKTPSRSTRKRFVKEVKISNSQLSSIPVANLFTLESYGIHKADLIDEVIENSPLTPFTGQHDNL